MITPFINFGSIDFYFIGGAVLFVLILIMQVKTIIHVPLLKNDDLTNIAAGKIVKRTIYQLYFIKITVSYNYTFEVEGITYKGKYDEAYRKMKKRGDLPDEQRIKYYTANPKINCLADIKLPPLAMSFLATAIALAFVVWYFFLGAVIPGL
ncbi:MAG: hypothetical protein ACTTKL_05160 [Treponema sp.]